MNPSRKPTLLLLATLLIALASAPFVGAATDRDDRATAACLGQDPP